MHIDDRRIRQLSEEVDDLHHESLATMAEELSEQHFGDAARDAGPERRALLRRAAAGGALLTVGALTVPLSGLFPAAWAEVAPSDTTLTQFAAGLELAAVAAYAQALATAKLSLSVETVANTFAGHHRQHADSLNGALGDTLAVTKPGRSVLARFTSKLSTAKTDTAALERLYLVEEVAAATYLFLIGKVSDVQSAGALAKILPVESSHATVLATVLGKAPKDYLVEFLTTDRAAKPA